MLNQKNVYAVIGAAGSGTRMGTAVPKQFLKTGEKTILEQTVSAFMSDGLVDHILIVTSPAWIDFTESLFDNVLCGEKITVVCGGKERQDSIREGLRELRSRGAADDSLVLVHDGVRPYVTSELIRACTATADRFGAAVPVVAPKDTIRERNGKTLDRSRLCCVQTPQAFHFALLEEAYQRAYEDGFFGTDDAGLVERLGLQVAIVEGDYRNRKITTPEDLIMEQRIGTGFDVHRLVPGRRLILGGVTIPFEKGLLGHSDADVLVHALMDAMLGATALGDIGKLFPDSDPAYSGISSILLLEKVGEAVRAKGYVLGNADLTVICQKPKLALHIEEMRRRIAEALDVSLDRISIKATTTEKLGFTGRGEGIAAEAICLLNCQKL